jgi:3-hydroxybutyryl-CoA dehydratase
MQQEDWGYFEDFVEGAEYETVGRTVTEADVVNFAGLTGDWSPVHTSIEHAKGGLFGERIAHGALTITLAEGLMNRLGLWNNTFMGLTDREWSFKAPVRFGDTIKVKMKITGKTDQSRYPGCGEITRHIVIENQKGEVLSEGDGTVIILKHKN